MLYCKPEKYRTYFNLINLSCKGQGDWRRYSLFQNHADLTGAINLCTIGSHSKIVFDSHGGRAITMNATKQAPVACKAGSELELAINTCLHFVGKLFPI